MRIITKVTILFISLSFNLLPNNAIATNNLYKEHLEQLFEITEQDHAAILAIVNFKETFFVFAKDFVSNKNIKSKIYYYILDNLSGNFVKNTINNEVDPKNIIKITKSQKSIFIYWYNSKELKLYKLTSNDGINWKNTVIS